MPIYPVLFSLSLIGILQGFFIAAVLFYRARKTPLLNRTMALLFFSGALAMLLIVAVNAGLAAEHPLITALEFTIALAVGPGLLFCVQISANSDEPAPTRALLHFIPAGVYLAGTTARFLIKAPFDVPVLAIMLHLQAYTLYSVILYVKMGKAARRQATTWLGFLLCFFACIGISQWVRFAFSDNELLNLAVPLTASVHFHLALIAGFNLNAPFFRIPREREPAADGPATRDGWQWVERQITGRRLYTQPGLTLNELAHQLQMPPHQLSDMLNRGGGHSFSEYINALRAAYAKQLLVNPEWAHLTVEAIGQEAGFQSRSAFYRHFRRATGQAPAEFQQNCPTFPEQDMKKEG